MHEQLITSINYPKLIEMQANQPAFGYDKKQSKKNVLAQPNNSNEKCKTKALTRTTCK